MTEQVAARGLRASLGKSRPASSLYSLAVRRRDRGVGVRMRRAMWNRSELDADTYVTPVFVDTWFTVRPRTNQRPASGFFVPHSLVHQATGKPRGQAYGVYTFRGCREDVVRPIRSAHKREWFVDTEPEAPQEAARALAAELAWVPPRSNGTKGQQ